VLGLGAALVGGAGLVAGTRWVLLSAALAALWLIAIALVWLWSPNANLDGDAIRLSNVHGGFVRAITETLPVTTIEGDGDTDAHGIGSRPET
jgi:hypothetical protein